MRIRPDTLTDKGCWISEDRIYALVTSPGHGVSEIGYHGRQPVSRNSRMLAQSHAVLECFLLSEGGTRTPIPFDDLEWSPGRVVSRSVVLGQQLEVVVQANSPALVLTFSPMPVGEFRVMIRYRTDSTFTDVQGERHWMDPSREGDTLRLSCRDRILFDSWIRRSGPYGGDFLIPEVWRRKVFRRQCRSGEATVDDVRPEYRDAALSLYDASIRVSLGGEDFALTGEEGAYLFTTRGGSGSEKEIVFTVRFADEPPAPAGGTGMSGEKGLSGGGVQASGERPGYVKLQLTGYPRLEEFFGVVPELVNSCVIKDYGVPRATPGRYYWIWAWDLLVTAVEMLLWGDVTGARRAVEFVNAHRDVDGRIPARWTRELEPLDTPDEGAAMEFLLAHLAYQVYLETGDVQDILTIYPALVGRFLRLQEHSGRGGLICGTGFYPDLPREFGRSDRRAVAMETGCWYGLCRILQNMAGLTGDGHTESLAAEEASTVQASFLPTFRDPAVQSLQDAVDVETGVGNNRHPLFSYLFLQSPLTLSLVRGRIPEIARFVRSELLTDHGVRTVPFSERGNGNEAVLDAWYPHWDLYALKLLRRAGDEKGIIHWLSLANMALEKLGYCPEYVGLKGFRDGDPAAWQNHGAPSNLNCVTGWYRGILEGICGLEIDPGGLTILPAPLPAGSVRVTGLSFRGGVW
ncbi:MAG: hypothetical protein WBH56_17285, partial [Bacteroidota bacterium]